MESHDLVAERPVIRTLAVGLLAGLALLLGAAPAFAHTRLISSDPGEGARLDTPPERISLTFNETVQSEFSTITVVGPDGGEWQAGAVEGAGDALSVGLRPLGPAGEYRIGYRIVADDGHPVTGSVSFTLTAPGPGGTAATGTSAPASGPEIGSATAAQQDAGGAPVWPWIAGAVLLVGGGVFAALRMGRR